MKKIVIHILTLVLIFILAVFGFSRYLNQGTTDTTEVMADATFPLVYMTNEGSLLNCLHGYTGEMDVTAMRDTLTPLKDDRTLSIRIEPYQNKINDISYEILSSDGKRTLEKTKINKMESEDGYVTATLTMQDTLLINTDYVLKLRVMAGSQMLYYYTRVIYEDGLHTKDYLDFATGFYERCLNKNDLDTISAYIEPNEEGDNTTFSFVDIHCTMDQLSWGSLKPQAYIKPIPSLKEINDSTATIVMDYVISAKNDQDETELYAVSEYYRMLYTEERIRLLDFERTTEEIFNPENSGVIRSNGINLGISGRDVVYKSDLKNNYIAFVKRGALWLYQPRSNKMTQVFTFNQEKADARDLFNQNDIQIVNIDEGGNIYFLVCGYMNRGKHEGESGVAVYYFNALDSSITECIFVDTRQNYELLKRDVEALNYISTDRSHFYVYVDGNVYGIDLAARQAELLVSGIKVDCYGSSRSGKYFAWMDGEDAYHADSIHILNLDTMERQEVSCGADERIRLLGFLEEDAVYGVANASDVNTEHEGMEFFPMKKIVIVNGNGETVKNYETGNYYVTDTAIEGKMMTMTRVQRQADGSFVEALEDHIVNSTAGETSQAGLTTRTTSRKETELILTTGSALSASSAPQIIRSREVIQEGSRTVSLDAAEKSDVYYVYAKGKLYDVYHSVSTAVKRADEELGVVVDSDLQNIWERGNKVNRITLDVSTFPQVILDGTMDVDAIRAGTGERALDLSGCTLDSVLYYVSEGTPVLARTPVTEKTPQGIVIIAGYDEYNTILLNPQETETFYYGINDSTDLFEEAGNLFMTYWDPISD